MSLTGDKSDKGSKNKKINETHFESESFTFFSTLTLVSLVSDCEKKEGIGLLNTTLKASSTNKLAQISRVLCENGFEFLYSVKGKRGITASLSLLIDK